jgi:hypothetical protein
MNESRRRIPNIEIPTVTLPRIDKLVKAFETHHTAVDFDAAFINCFVPEIDEVLMKHEQKKSSQMKLNY